MEERRRHPRVWLLREASRLPGAAFMAVAVGVLGCFPRPGVLMAESVSAARSPVAADPQTQKMGLAIAFAANAFRLAASSNINAAVQGAGTDEFKQAWLRTIAPYFQKQEIHWHDFFSSAVILIGDMNPDGAVVAFYNPWVDGLVLTRWQGKIGALRAAEFAVLCGETWRAEPIDEHAGLPEWSRRQGSLPELLARIYKTTVGRFESRFPPILRTGETIPALAGEGVVPLIQLAPLKARMVNRMRMFSQFLRNTLPTKTARPPVAMVDTLLGAIAAGSEDALGRLVVHATSPGVLATISKLPEALRKGMAPNMIAVKPAGGVIALLSPGAPEWFILAYFDPKASDGRFSDVQLFNFETIGRLVK